MTKERIDIYTTELSSKLIQIDGRLPFGLNHVVYLIGNKRDIIQTLFLNSEGNHVLLPALERLGQEKGIMVLKSD